MCGISVLVRSTGLTPEDSYAVKHMTNAMHHRGPDSEGFLSATNAALGIRRLSIIDRAMGDQPIDNTDCNRHPHSGRFVAVVFNGEIYNFRELANELKSCGHRFKTNSDTETILHAYEEWGPDCVHRLRGMFVFCVVESSEAWSNENPPKVQRAFIARDRMGIKPLYYHCGNGLLLVASEVRALLSSGMIPYNINIEGVHSYLAFGSLQEPLTMIDGVHSLLPGHWMIIDAHEGTYRTHQYWDLPVRPANLPQEEQINQKNLIGNIAELLSDSVSMRLISEVPIGAFLSGGIDSGSVVSLMSRVSDKKPNTFNITFKEDGFSEARLAQMTATISGAHHNEITVTSETLLRDLPKALSAFDQPSLDGINTYYVAGAAKKAGLTVALSGLGGDELFAGYEHFKHIPTLLKYQNVWNYLPQPLQALSARAWLSLGRNSDRRLKLASFMNGQTYFDHPYFASRMVFTPHQARELLTANPNDLIENSDWNKRVQSELTKIRVTDPVNAVSYLECKNYLPSMLLRDTDAMSMAHSLEVRVPLIDHVLAEFMMGIPGHLKVNKNKPKPLLVNALSGALPKEVVNRPKSTFIFPWQEWLRQDLKNEVGETLNNPPNSATSVLDANEIRAVWQRFLNSETSWSRPWSLYVLLKWLGRETS